MSLVATPADAHHVVQFYETDEFLTGAVADFLARGLDQGEAAVVIATAPHRAAIVARLEATCPAFAAARAAGRLVLLDAAETLRRFMIDERPDWPRFRDCIEATFAAVTGGDRTVPIRAFGEMVDLLWRAGNPTAAIGLEELWNDLQRTRSFTLLCAYVMGNLYKEGAGAGLSAVCAIHDHVRPPERTGDAGPYAHALAAEIAQRIQVEQALRAALRDVRDQQATLHGQAHEHQRLLEAERASRDRASFLYRLARAVIVADTVDDVFAAALDAIVAGLATPRAAILTNDAAGVMRFRAWRGLSDAYRAAVDGHSPWPRDAQDPPPLVVADVETDVAMADYRPLFRDERIGALAFIPLVADRRLLGKFMVYFEAAHAPAQADDLARAIADHVAAALSRFLAVAELRETVRFNELFTGILGHDLRNPLGAIMTSAQLALLRNDNDQLSKPLSRIVTSSERMGRMIEQLLDFTRVRLGAGIPLAPRGLDLVPVVRQVMDVDGRQPRAWTLRLEHGGDTAGTWDGDRLGQVFSNLIANAVQHGVPAHGIRVRIDGSARHEVRVETHNHGAIPAALLPRVFEPLAGGTRAQQRSRGLGLGLYITREIVLAHRGRIDVRSDDVAGTTFTVTLPRASS